MTRRFIGILALLAVCAAACAELPEPWRAVPTGGSEGSVRYSPADEAFHLRGAGRVDHDSHETFFVHRELGGYVPAVRGLFVDPDN